MGRGYRGGIMDQEHSAGLTETEVYESLKTCYDPEIPVNVVDLGLIYDVKIIDDWVGVKMTLTTPGCGMSGMISRSVRDQLLTLPGIKDADVRIVWDPAWSPAMMSDEARKKLGVR
jgi:metal-sulfur cluster biosynthetic enzyme